MVCIQSSKDLTLLDTSLKPLTNWTFDHRIFAKLLTGSFAGPKLNNLGQYGTL